jgi:hypothetical protein
MLGISFFLGASLSPLVSHKLFLLGGIIFAIVIWIIEKKKLFSQKEIPFWLSVCLNIIFFLIAAEIHSYLLKHPLF